MVNRIFIFIICISVSCYLFAGSYYECLEDISLRKSWYNEYSKMLYYNPATIGYRYNRSLSFIEGTFDRSDSSRPFIMQKGSGYIGGAFHADAYIRINKKSVVWGEASYNNGSKDNVGWNESSDYDRIYPYVTADTIGGNMNRESYFFKGGYGYKAHLFSVGVQMTYSSAMEYREKDPRPKNNSVYINASLGMSYALHDNYAIGTYIVAERYNQTQDIDFFDPIGTVPLYHMLGLGMQYVRFAGTKADAFYKGRSFSWGLTLQSLKSDGFNAVIGFENYALQKQLPDLNNAPLNDIAQWKYLVELTTRFSNAYVRFSGFYHNRNGKERIYDDGSTNWHEISSSKPYRERLLSAGLQGGNKWFFNNKFTFDFFPEILFNMNKSRYYPSRKESIMNIFTSLNAGFHYSSGRNLLITDISAGYKRILDSDLYISNPDTFSPSLEMLYSNYKMQSSHISVLKIGAEYHIGLKRFCTSMYLRACYEYDSDFNVYDRHSYNIGVGFSL